jgi:hypothetical protein
MSLRKKSLKVMPGPFACLKSIQIFYCRNKFFWLLLSFSKTAQSKQAPNRWIFAQSGHPVTGLKSISSSYDTNSKMLILSTALVRGCQMAYFQTQKSQFGYILQDLAVEDFGYILWPFDIFFDRLVNFMAIWWIISRFGMLYQ